MPSFESRPAIVTLLVYQCFFPPVAERAELRDFGRAEFFFGDFLLAGRFPAVFTGLVGNRCSGSKPSISSRRRLRLINFSIF